jgi:hypothetical protein
VDTIEEQPLHTIGDTTQTPQPPVAEEAAPADQPETLEHVASAKQVVE